METLNRLTTTLYIRYDEVRQRCTDERGAISLEAAIIGGILLVIAVSVAAKFGALQDDAEQKIPDSL